MVHEKTVNIKIPDELARPFQQACHQRKRTLSTGLRQLIDYSSKDRRSYKLNASQAASILGNVFQYHGHYKKFINERID